MTYVIDALDSTIAIAQIGDILFEAADWIIEGFDRGAYFNAAQNGKVIWDMATT